MYSLILSDKWSGKKSTKLDISLVLYGYSDDTSLPVVNYFNNKSQCVRTFNIIVSLILLGPNTNFWKGSYLKWLSIWFKVIYASVILYLKNSYISSVLIILLSLFSIINLISSLLVKSIIKPLKFDVLLIYLSSYLYFKNPSFDLLVNIPF